MIRLSAFFLILLTAGLYAETRPNILLLFADDLGCHASAYARPGHPSPNDSIRTPVFDAVAAKGVLFENAFVSSPSCTPSRGSIYTGRHFFRNGSASQLHNPWTDGFDDPFAMIEGMPVALRKAGYHIGWSHKWHLPERLGGGIRHNFERHGKRINRYSQNVMQAEDPEAMKDAILGEVRANFRDFLSHRTDDQPFFYSFNPTNTHRHWARGSARKLWGLDPDELKGKLPPFLPDNPVVREDFADYLGEAMAFDAACGAIIDELAALGELDNTLVCITGDHGAPGFPGGKCNVHDFGSRVLLALRWPEKIRAGVVRTPVSLIDLAPTFLAAAGIESPDDPDGQNLLPALAPGGDESGLRGWALIGREAHVRQARERGMPYPVRALRTADHLYVINHKPDRWPMGAPLQVRKNDAPSWDELISNTRIAFADIDGSPTKAWLIANRHEKDLKPFIDFAWGKRPGEELYDVREDPHQMTNLAGSTDHRAIREKLRERLLAELQAKEDPRLDNDAFDRPPYNPPSAD